MTWSMWVRQTHRWLSIIFTAIVAFIFISLGFGREPAEWLYFAPLFPLSLMLVSGLYLFALPYAGKRRTTDRAR